MRGKPFPGRLDVDRDGGLACEIGEGCGKPVVKPRRPHAGGNGSQIRDRVADLVDRRVESRPEHLRLPRKRALQPSQHDPEGHEPLLRTVVKIALEATAFLVAGLNDPGARLVHLHELQPHLHSEPGDLDCQARCLENAVEEIGAVEQVAPVPEQPDLLPSMLDRRQCTLPFGRPLDDAACAVGVCVARREPKDQLRARIAQGRCELGSDLLRLSPPVADVVDEGAHASQTFETRAGESPVDHGLRPSPQRPEGKRDDDRANGGRPRRTSADDHACHYRNDAVDETERRSYERVDERPVDQAIDLVQPVAHHGDAD